MKKQSLREDTALVLIYLNPTYLSLSPKVKELLATKVPANVLLEESALFRLGKVSVRIRGRRLLKEFLFQRYDGKCFCCGEPLDLSLKPSKKKYTTFEHVLPITKGGKSVLENLALSHKDCNAERGNKNA